MCADAAATFWARLKLVSVWPMSLCENELELVAFPQQSRRPSPWLPFDIHHKIFGRTRADGDQKARTHTHTHTCCLRIEVGLFDAKPLESWPVPSG